MQQTKIIYPSIRKSKSLKQKLDEDRIERIQELHEKGISTSEICKLYSVPPRVVREIVDPIYRNKKIRRMREQNSASIKRRLKKNPKLKEEKLKYRRNWYAKHKDDPEWRKKHNAHKLHLRKVKGLFYFRKFWELIERDSLRRMGL